MPGSSAKLSGLIPAFKVIIVHDEALQSGTMTTAVQRRKLRKHTICLAADRYREARGFLHLAMG